MLLFPSIGAVNPQFVQIRLLFSAGILSSKKREHYDLLQK